MATTKKLVLVYSNQGSPDPGEPLDRSRLLAALRARGAEVDECRLDSDPDALLDLLADGATPVFFRQDSGR